MQTMDDITALVWISVSVA